MKTKNPRNHTKGFGSFAHPFKKEKLLYVQVIVSDSEVITLEILETLFIHRSFPSRTCNDKYRILEMKNR